MLVPKSEKLTKLKENYESALKKEIKNLEKQLNNFSKSLIELSIKNENFFKEFSKILEKDECKKLKEQYTKIIEMYK